MKLRPAISVGKFLESGAATVAGAASYEESRKSPSFREPRELIVNYSALQEAALECRCGGNEE